jgi:hypothetical protein
MLPTFAEFAFLTHINVRDAVHRSFDRDDLLTHTPVILLKRPEQHESGAVVIEQFVYSNQDCPWGLELPNCPTCESSLFVLASMSNNGSNFCRIRCTRCKSSASKVGQPDFVQNCDRKHLAPHKYFILPFPVPSHPWGNIQWSVKEFIPDEQATSEQDADTCIC